MKRWIYTYEEITGDPARVEDTLVTRSAELLRLVAAVPTGQEPSGDGSFLLELESHLAVADLAKQIRITTGVARRDDHRVVVPVQWHAEPAQRMFPSFEGAFEWEPLASNLGQLTLTGSYSIPLGMIGGLVDATVLRGVAHRTARHLVRRLAQEVQRLQGDPYAVLDGVGAAPASPAGPLHVRDVMTTDPLVLDESMPLRTAALVLASAELGGAPVVAADGALVGVLTDTDLLYKEAEQRFGRVDPRRRNATTVGAACSRPAQVTAPDATLAAAAQVMLDHDVSRLVVVGGARIVGLLTRRGVLSALIRSDRELLVAVRAELDAAGADDIEAAVEWGAVQLTGTTRLRSTALSLRRRVERIDGVVSVGAEALQWDTDDIIPALTVARMHM
jgi:CBS domain-containing protein